MLCHKRIILIILLHVMNKALSLFCSRYPINTITSKTPVDDNFAILINENTQTYVLGQEYNITLNSFNDLRFVSFNIVLENENGDVGYENELGHFKLFDSVETRYSTRCDNMVENTNTNPKTTVSIAWVAPKISNSGCVLIRATVVQNRDVWYMDDGALTRRICEKLQDDVESQNVLRFVQPCCACDEARYDVIFESLWSRNIHPKDFPVQNWIARFSDIVGATHSTSYRFWQYGNLATTAMKEFAENGLTNILEREFDAHFKSGEIRTVIKARGPAYPNLNIWSVATIRVDRKRHLLSLAAKINPSPDWIVGVSGIELCLTNCTWLEHKIFPLYPSDLGTQAGPTYVSPTQPQVPPDVIRSMRTDFNDSRSPFYDTNGVHMKPLATLTVKRQRLYNRLCDDEESNNIDIPRECQTHPWSPWSMCTTKCGVGMQYRSRVYKHKELARIYNCNEFIINKQNRTCEGENCNSDDFESFTKNSFESFGKMHEGCRLTDWGPWSECNATCGDGVRKRTRQYVNYQTENQCQNTTYANLSEYKVCSDHFCVGGAHRQNKNLLGNEDKKLIIDSDKEWNSPNKEDTRYNTATSINGAEDSNNILKFDIYDQIKEFKNSHGKLFHNLNKKPSQELSIDDNINFRHNFEYTPAYCFEPIVTYVCPNAAIIRNYWFYNYCTNECMLYTVDSCDHNRNKFSSLEMCESNCRRREMTELSKRKQLEDCN